MCSVGERVVARYTVDGPVYGFVIGHMGDRAIIAPDDGGDSVIMHCFEVRRARGTRPKPLVLKPSGAIVPLSREEPRVRSRRNYGAVQEQGAAEVHVREASGHRR